MKIFILLLFTLSFIPNAFAGKVYSGTVTEVRIDSSGKGILRMSKNKNNLSCAHPAYAGHFSFNTNSVGGKAIYANALSAKATGTLVHAFGKDRCNEYGSVESLNYMIQFN